MKIIHRTAAILLTTLAALLFTACGDGATEHQTGTSGDPPGPRVLVISIDGLEPSLLREMMQSGDLPHFQRLVRRGSMATIDAVVGTTSPVVWTTVATGTHPEEHGITGFTVDDQPVTSSMRRRPAFWNILTEHGLDVATVGWMVTWPAEDGAGVIVSDRSHWGRFGDKVAPEDVVDVGEHKDNPRLSDAKRIAAQFTDYPYDPMYKLTSRDDPSYAVNFLLDRRLISIFERDTIYNGIAKELLRTRKLDLMAVYFQGIDYVSHGFWKWFEPKPYREKGWEIDPAEVEQLEDVIPLYYRYIDRLVGELVAEVEDDTLIMVLSDHGFGTGLGQYRVEAGDFISGNHRTDAVLILSGPAAARGVDQDGQVTHFDILPTLLYYLDLPLDKDFRGDPLMAYFRPGVLENRDIRLVDAYAQDGEGAAEGETTEHDEEILKELRSLGYIQ